MSVESGGDGYGKFRKSCQTGGASGWAKHCGDTKDHQMSNRLERRAAKQDLQSGRERGVGAKGKSKKKPTRRHLLQRLEQIDKELAVWSKREEEDRKDHAKCKPRRDGLLCMHVGLRGVFGDNWHTDWIRDRRAKVLKDFVKYGYDLPTGA